MRTFDNILFARDFSPGSEHAAPFAVHMASTSGALLHVFYAETLNDNPFAPPPELPATPAQKMRAYARHFLEEKTPVTFDPEDVRIKYVVERGVPAAGAILEYARLNDIDLIVVGTRGRSGLRRLMLGSVAEEVVRRAQCPVLSVHPTDAPPSARSGRTIVVPVDFSAASVPLLHAARGLAATFETSLSLIHVIDKPLYDTSVYVLAPATYDVPCNDYAERLARLKATYEESEGPDVPCSFAVRTGVPAAEILRYARETSPRLIVMATAGRTGTDRFLLGSVAAEVVREAPCPVFTERLSHAPMPPRPALRSTAAPVS